MGMRPPEKPLPCDAHVGTAALGCPVERSSTASTTPHIPRRVPHFSPFLREVGLFSRPSLALPTQADPSVVVFDGWTTQTQLGEQCFHIVNNRLEKKHGRSRALRNPCRSVQIRGDEVSLCDSVPAW
jgi:hypothetical protein